MAPWIFLWDLWLKAKTNEGKLGLLNRRNDYLRLAGKPTLFTLHSQLNALLAEAQQAWGSYDYGEGYFYQSFSRVGVSGLRQTEARIESMELKRHLKGQRILEIGCNSGFISLALAEVIASSQAFDINPHLIQIADTVRKHLEISNVSFSTSAFETFAGTGPYDAVLSFANHATYDGNTHQNLKAFFERCHTLLKPGGLLLFESHPPELENARALEEVKKIMTESFKIESEKMLSTGSYADRRRTFIVARQD